MGAESKSKIDNSTGSSAVRSRERVILNSSVKYPMQAEQLFSELAETV